MWLIDLLHDARYAVRSWRRTPAFALVSILTLGLAVGATTAVFSVVEATLLRPLPYAHPDRLVAIWDGHVKDKALAKIFASYADFENWREHSTTLDRIAAATWATGEQILTGQGDAKVALAIPASVDFFSVLGVAPAVGRTFESADLARGCTVVLAHRFWQNTMASRGDVVGGSVTLDDRACAVVGVMPARFAFYPQAADMWRLITPGREELPQDRYQGVGVFARLRDGVSREQAQAEIASLHTLQHGQDAHASAFGPTVRPLQDEFTWLAGRNLQLTLWVLFAAVNGVLLIACVNVANLLLGRSLVRQREFAIRVALGSGTSRVVRQVLAEALMLALCAGALAIALAALALAYLRAASPVDLPPGVVLAINPRVMTFALTMAALTSIAFGFLPALRACHADIRATLQSAARAVAGRPAANRAARMLVAFQMTCAMVLLVAAGLLLESIRGLGTAPLGFNPDGLLTMSVKLPRVKYATADQRVAFYDRLVAALRGIPGADGAALSTTLLRGRTNNMLLVEGRPDPRPDTAAPDVADDAVSVGYFGVMGVSILSGRDFRAADRRESATVAIVNEALARKYFPGANPIGQRVRTPNSPWATIVGVAGNQKTASVYQEMNWIEAPFIYRPIMQRDLPQATALVRSGAPSSLGAAVQRVVADLDRDVPVSDIETMRARLAKDLAYPRFRAWIFGGFAVLALLLAAVGLYAAVSQLVAQRTHEFGVRMALGATPRDIARLVAVYGGVPTIVGLAAGTICTLALERILASLLYGVSATDGPTLAAVAAGLLIVAAMAILAPVRRATSADPLTALRSE